MRQFKNGGIGTTILLTEVGIYTFTASNQTYSDNGFCPMIIEPDGNCRPDSM